MNTTLLLFASCKVTFLFFLVKGGNFKNSSRYQATKWQRPGPIEQLQILSQYSTVQQIYNDKDILFSNAHPEFYMLADKKNIAYVEIAPNHKFSFILKDKGILTHTNHYLDNNLLAYNEKKYPSSHIRFTRINELLDEKKDNFSLSDFKNFADDRLHSPNNSIWRTSADNYHERTVATWIVSIPHEGSSPYIYIKLAAPNANGTIIQGALAELLK